MCDQMVQMISRITTHNDLVCIELESLTRREGNSLLYLNLIFKYTIQLISLLQCSH
jgi:hypothetical protein